MSYDSVRTGSNQPTRCGIRSGMKASPAKGYAGPYHQCGCCHLKSDSDRVSREEHAKLIKANQCANHHDQPKNRNDFQHLYSGLYMATSIRAGLFLTMQ